MIDSTDGMLIRIMLERIDRGIFRIGSALESIAEAQGFPREKTNKDKWAEEFHERGESWKRNHIKKKEEE